MELTKQTEKIQNLLAQYCRTGIETDIEGLTPGRVHHYRRLVYNVISGTLEQAYPLTYDLVSQDQWDDWVDRFFATAKLDSPQLFRMPEKFYEWSLENEMDAELGLPYLNDLLLFEWVEIEVHTMKDIEFPYAKTQGDILDDVLVVNPEYRLIELEYPVHLIPVAECEEKKGKYYVLVFREPIHSRVQFVDLSLLHLYLIQKIMDSGTALVNLIPEAVSLFSLDTSQNITNKLIEFFKDLKYKGFIIGFNQENNQENNEKNI